METPDAAPGHDAPTDIADPLLAAAAERGVAADGRISAEAERGVAADGRISAEAARTETLRGREDRADERDLTAADRDLLADERDLTAAERDLLADERDETAGVREEVAQNGRAAVADEQARHERELQIAGLDELTGCYRREIGRLELGNGIEHARRGDGRFVIAFVDVEGLKVVNDRDGHAAGDQVLRTLAAILRDKLRSYDPIVRHGGDEFVCGIGGIDPAEVELRFVEIDRAMREAVGVGITTGLSTLADGDTLDELTGRADAALLERRRNKPERHR